MSPALQFMHLLAYVDTLWFGEGYDYNESPEYWLVEVSGLPFGLMGDMMREGNTWRGMVYGMSSRFRGADPSPIWDLWDVFGIENATMIGYWQPDPPTALTGEGCGEVRATTYVPYGRSALIAIASWEHEPVSCRLAFDYTSLGIRPSLAKLRAPHLLGGHVGQDAADFALEGPNYAPTLHVPSGRGWLLMLEGGAGEMVEAEHDQPGGREGREGRGGRGPLGVPGEAAHAAAARRQACRARGGAHCQ